MAKQADYPTLTLIPRLVASMKHLLPRIGFAVFFAVAGQVVTIAIPVLLVRQLFAALEGETASWAFLALLVSLAFLRGAFRYGEHYFGHYVAFHTLAAFRKLVFAKLRRLAPAKLDGQDSGHLLKMVGEDIEALEIFFAHTLAPISTGMLVASLLFVGFAWQSWLLALLALVTYALLALLLPVWFAGNLEGLLKEQNQARKGYVSYFIESLKSMKDLLQFQQSGQRLDALEARSLLVNQQERRVAQTQFMQYALSFLVIGLAIMVFAGLCLRGLQAGDWTLVDAVSLLVAFTSSFAPFLELNRLPLGFKRAMNAGRNIFSLLDEEEIVDKGTEVAVKIENIRLDGVTFSYSNRDQLLYQELSCLFDQRGIIGLVGQSGAGKSTLMKLIMRWYAWQEGDIYLSEQDSQTISRAYLQGKFAYVPQVPQLFQQSIRDNILLGRTGISDQEILDLAEACYLKERILSSPEGLDTLVQSPTDFSAGEGQRLELMRALLKNADCYIFDEPTSNLDSLNEARFIQLVRQHCKGMVFLISHRASTMASADHIFRLENGRFVKEK